MNNRRAFLRVVMAGGMTALVAPSRVLAGRRRRWRTYCCPVRCCCAPAAVALVDVWAGDPDHQTNAFVDQVSKTPETTIHVGDTVRWTHKYGDEHTIVSVNTAPFNLLNPPLNGDISSGDPPYQYTFNQAGDFGYRCTVHGGDPAVKTGMWGIVHVR